MDKFLKQFLEVATLKNVSHAAKKLCLTQPTLTHNMKKLEADLGVTLLIRSSSGIELTECGEVLLEQARMMQRLYDNTLRKLDRIKERYEREIRLGSGHAWWYLFVDDALDSYRQRHSAANLHFELGNHLRLMDMLLSSDLDLFVGHEIPGLSSKAGVMFEPLFVCTNALFVREDHPLTFHESGMDDLLDYPHIYVTPDETRYQHVVEDLQPKKYERTLMHMEDRIVYSSNSLAACVEMMQRTNAVMPFPSNMAGYFRQFGLVPLKMHDNCPPGTVGIYQLRGKSEDPHINELVALLHRHLKANEYITPPGRNQHKPSPKD